MPPLALARPLGACSVVLPAAHLVGALMYVATRSSSKFECVQVVCAKWARGHWEVVGTSVPVGGRDSTTSIELHMVRAARTALPAG